VIDRIDPRAAYCGADREDLPVTRVLIAGASIAGPTLAHWLHRYGFEVTVVERSPAMRPGGQAVDLRGIAKEAAARTGLMDQIRAACTDTAGMSLENARYRTLVTHRCDDFGGDGMIAEIEILRGDLAEVLYRNTRDDVEYRFGDQIAALSQDDDGVDVTFEHGATGRYDLVVGADGVGSQLRELVFGPPERFRRDLGLLLCFFTVPNKPADLPPGRKPLHNWAVGYNEIGRGAGVRSIRDNNAAMAYLHAEFDGRDLAERGRDVEAQKDLVRELFAGAGWMIPWLLEQLDEAADFYLDSSCQIELPSWSSGRVALLGDAAYCASPMSGAGTGLAMIGAYLLAGELAKAGVVRGGEHAPAFAEYERWLRTMVTPAQKMGRDHARQVVAHSRVQLWAQVQFMRLLAHPPLRRLVMRHMRRSLNPLELPDYE
jgi:2-polyprenyl-6-methoxyphenol hydroxylase-like FAD-dependent oxidoreductase